MAERNRGQETDGGREAARATGENTSPNPDAPQRTATSGESQQMPAAPHAPQTSGRAENYDVDAAHYVGGHGPLQEGETPQSRAFQRGAFTPAEGSAEDREKQMARSRGVAEDELDQLEENTKWLVSNRVDDRVVLWERDPKHPGGEIVVGGSGPVRGYMTPAVQERVFRGEIAVVDEPLEFVEDEEGNQVPNRKYPPEPGPDPAIVVAAQPGRPTPLGRKLDPELWDEGARQKHARAIRGMPSHIPVPQGAIVPTVGDVERRR